MVNETLLRRRDVEARTPSAANIAAYADIVRERSLLRQVIISGKDITELGYKPGGQEIGVILDKANRILRDLNALAARAEDSIWQADLSLNKDNRPLATLSNLVAVLDLHPAWKDRTVL